MLAKKLYQWSTTGKVFWLTFQGWVAVNMSVENKGYPSNTPNEKCYRLSVHERILKKERMNINDDIF